MSEFLLRILTQLVDTSIKLLFLTIATGLILKVLGVRHSGAKHLAWLGVLSSLILLPLFSVLIPAVPLPWSLLPDWRSAHAPSYAPAAESLAAAKDASHPMAPPFADATTVALPEVLERPDTNTNHHPARTSPPALPPGSAASDISARSTNWNLPRLVVSAWMCVSAMLLARLIWSIQLVRTLVSRATRLPEQEILSQLSALPASAVSVCESRLIFVPLTTGSYRPNILLPQEWRSWPEDKLHQVLIHEMTHIRRGDCWTSLVAEVLTSIYWFHPVVWWLKRQLAMLAEECCDAAAINSTGNRATYARHLLEIATVLNNRPSRLNYAGLAMTRQSQVERRILTILDTRRPLSQRIGWPTITVLMALLLPTMVITSAMRPAFGDNSGHQDDKAEVTTATRTNEPEIQPKRNQPGAKEGSNDQPQLNLVTRSETPTAYRVQGRVTGPNGKPVDGAAVAVIASSVSSDAAGEKLVAKGTTHGDGHYEILAPGLDASELANPKVVARADGMALGWRLMEAELQQTCDLTLEPEQPILFHLIDLQGKPAAGVKFESITIGEKGGEEKRMLHWRFNQEFSQSPVAPALRVDDNGLCEIRGLSELNWVHMITMPSESFAPQYISVNTGMPEFRPEGDSTYRGICKNLEPGEVGTIALAPARIFEGVVLLGETNQPAANSRISIWASEQEPWGSMISIFDKTDANGRFKLNPLPGVRFGIIAHPPQGAPYMIRELEPLKWEATESVKNLEIRLPSGLVSQGTVVDAETGQPLAKASVQYYPNRAAIKTLPPNLITGWQGIQTTDEQGRFSIPVAQGPGTLLIHAPAGANYVLREMPQQQVDRGTPGGIRYYAHAFQAVDPTDPASASGGDLQIKLKPGRSVSVKLVDEAGKPIKDAIYTSRLKIVPTSPFWRAFSDTAKQGRAEIHGLEPGQSYPVYFLDTARKLGAVAEISLDQTAPTVVLTPCATAKVRYLDKTGKPVRKGLQFGINMVATPGEPRYSTDRSRLDLLRADEDFSVNFDQKRDQMGADANGVELTRYLVPGGTYRLFNMQTKVATDFTAESGRTHDLGDVIVDLDN